MKEEPVDILDENMNKTGQTMLKSEAHKHSLWHGGAHIWIYNSKGEVLMQRRSPKKLLRPNIWDVSVAGHIAAGRTPEETVVGEAAEELGLSVNRDNLVFLGNANIRDKMDGWTHNVVLWIYALQMELDPKKLILEEAETAEVKWVPLEQLAAELKDPAFKDKYAPTPETYYVAIDKIPELKTRELTDEERATVETYDKHGQIWAKKYSNQTFYDAQFSTFKQLIPSGRILEIGAGAGRDAKVLVDLGYEYIGTDISDTLLKIAMKKLPEAKFMNCSVYDLPFIREFDGFWCTATLLHIPEEKISQALSSIKKCLKPNAIGFITIKDREGSEMEDYEIEPGVILKRFYQYWSRTEFTEVLQRNRFEVIKYNFKPVNNRQEWHQFFVKLK